MPKKFKRTKIKRRRKVRRRNKKRSGPTTKVMRGPQGFPDRIKVKLNYFAEIDTTNTFGAASVQQFRGNSVFDPDLTGTGHQPMGFDQWSAFYGHYRVSGSSLRIGALVPGGTAFINTDTVGCSFGIVPATSSSLPTVTELVEWPYSKWRQSTFYTPIKGVSAYMSTAKMLGVNKASVKNEDNNSALISANPTNQWYWNLLVFPANGTQTTYWTYTVKLTYYVEFFGRVNLAIS